MHMIDWNSCPAVELNPELVSGAWVFRGTRVPVVALFENLEDGVTVNEFVWHSPNSVDKYYCQNLNGRNANAKSQIHS